MVVMVDVSICCVLTGKLGTTSTRYEYLHPHYQDRQQKHNGGGGGGGGGVSCCC